MGYRGQGQKVQKVMVQPINLIFRYLQNRSRIQVWLYEQVNMRIEGCIMADVHAEGAEGFRAVAWVSLVARLGMFSLPVLRCCWAALRV
nr:small nuclear ribonucleoprotein E-like [Anas platyrhynchos]